MLLRCWSKRLGLTLLTGMLTFAAAPADRLVIQGKSGPGKGKRVVLVSGDEEYRSEQALPQLARILAERLKDRRVIVENVTVRKQAIGPRPDDMQMLRLVGIDAKMPDVEDP